MKSQKQLTISNYIWTTRWWFMNKDRFDVAPEEQAAIHGNVVPVAWYRSELDRAYARQSAGIEGRNRHQGRAIYPAMVKPVYAQFAKEWGADLVSAVEKAASAD